MLNSLKLIHTIKSRLKVVCLHDMRGEEEGDDGTEDWLNAVDRGAWYMMMIKHIGSFKRL